MIDREYNFIINGTTEVFFTPESRITFYDTESEKELFSIDPTDLVVVLAVYERVMTLFRQYDAEDEEMMMD